MAEVIGVRFKNTGKVYYFDPQGQQVEKGAMAIVETFLHTDFEGGRHMRRIAKLAISNEAE